MRGKTDFFRAEAVEHHATGHRGEGAPLKLRSLLANLRPQRVPHVQGLGATDCGAACLAMTLRYYGRHVPLDEVRERLGSARDGTTLLMIKEAAQRYGLRARGVRVEIEELACLEAGTVLHWGFNHFVVFQRLRRDAVDILDPAAGERRIPLLQFRRMFTGVALLLEPSAEFQPVPAEGSRAWRHLKVALSDSPLRFAQLLLATLLIQLCVLAVPLLTKVIVDRVVPRQDYTLLATVACGGLGLILFGSVTSFMRTHLLLALRTRLDLRLTGGFVEHLTNLPYAFFNRHPAGDLLARMNSTATIREMLTSGLLGGVLDGTLIGLYLIGVFWLNASLAMLTLALGVAQIIIFLCSRHRYQWLLSEDLELQAKAQSYGVQMLSGIETLKASGAERRAVEGWSHAFVDVLNSALRRGRFRARTELASGMVRGAAPLLLLWIGVHKVIDGELSLGGMLAITWVAGGFLTALSSLISTGMQLQLLGGYLERVDEVLETEPEQDKSGVQPAQRLSGCITLRNVTFRYGTDGAEAVRNVSLEMLPGQSIAIVGQSGSGKSTLAKLLLGLYQPSAGSICYDGADLRELETGSVRNQLGIVMQHAYLFGTTIREAIRLNNPELSLDEVIQAARLAHVHDDIMRMPLGYDTPLIDGGATLSGGQRQRIALACALVRQPAILLLDEATSHLDAVTESRIHAELARLQATRIIIAHRLSTILRADVILVMEDGQVVEQGTHEELLALGGKYGDLVAAQVGDTVVV